MFTDRNDAGRRLAKQLRAYRDQRDTVVVAIPRGGVVIGAVLARALNLPLDVILTKKIGHPQQPEFAIGVVNLNHEVIDASMVEAERIPREYLDAEIKRIRQLLRRRYEAYRGQRKPLSLKGKTVILTDDGVATGKTIQAAVRLTRDEGAKKVVIAVPVGPADTLQELSRLADEVVCLTVPDSFLAIGQVYDDFEQVSDEEAMRLLAQPTAAVS